MEKFGKEYHLAYYHARRNKFVDLLGGECVRCGSKENLEFDHINPAEKEINISRVLKKKLATAMKEISKCQLLCEPCHLQKTLDERNEFTHGTTYGWMKKNCSCEACLLAREKYNKSRRENRSYVKGPYSKNPSCGTRARYSRGCRCDECRAANTENARRLKALKALAA